MTLIRPWWLETSEHFGPRPELIIHRVRKDPGTQKQRYLDLDYLDVVSEVNAHFCHLPVIIQ